MVGVCLIILVAMAPKTLHGIHKRPGASARLLRLRRPASNILKVDFDANLIQEHWPILGLPNYSVVRLPEGARDWNGFLNIEFAVYRV